MIEDQLVEVLSRALEQAAPGLGIDGDLPTPELLAPKRRDHGDFATNVALELAKRAGKPPREVAQAIADALPPAPFLERAEVAGPGFLNLFVTDAWLHDALREIAAAGERYGRVDPHGRRVQVEFVSANPTGPLTLGHARNAAIGDAVARLLEATGWAVEREYYFNDAGGQMDRFGASVEARFLQLVGRELVEPLGRLVQAPHGVVAGQQASQRDQDLAVLRVGLLGLGLRLRLVGRLRGGLEPVTVTVDLIQPTGSRTYATFRLNGAEVMAELQAHEVERPGERLTLHVDMNRAIVIDPDTDRVL